jgi:tRNA(fMet)-specific endonuclease VapC
MKRTLTHLLDTSVFSQPLRKKPLPVARDRWVALGDPRLATSIICEAEVQYGVTLSGSADLVARYQALLKDRLPVLVVDARVATEFAVLKAWAKNHGRTCSDFDFLIGATAKAHALIVATLNYRDFRWMPGVAVEDWKQAL